MTSRGTRLTKTTATTCESVAEGPKDKELSHCYSKISTTASLARKHIKFRYPEENVKIVTLILAANFGPVIMDIRVTYSLTNHQSLFISQG